MTQALAVGCILETRGARFAQASTQPQPLHFLVQLQHTAATQQTAACTSNQSDAEKMWSSSGEHAHPWPHLLLEPEHRTRCRTRRAWCRHDQHHRHTRNSKSLPFCRAQVLGLTGVASWEGKLLALAPALHCSLAAMAGRGKSAVDAVGELAQLSLVSKVCTELENNCGINDPTLGARFTALAPCLLCMLLSP